MNNIFTAIISTLNTIPVSGEDNYRKMLMVIDTLHQMEQASNAPEEEKGEGES